MRGAAGLSITLDPSLREYHEKIAARIEAVRPTPADSARDRYYIHKTRPFFVGGRIYYEVTFYRAINKVSKFDRKRFEVREHRDPTVVLKQTADAV